MVVSVEYDGLYVQLDGPVIVSDIKNEVLCVCNPSDFYMTYNGKRLEDTATVHSGIVRAIPRLLGGKGGFGSMLRAIGAQIEKTTNREACRDLSGRRLRDINEEKRLKNWIAQQAEREREAAERRKKKLERLCFEPKHEFCDQNYEKARTELTDKVHDAVEQGFRSAGTSTNELKRKTEPQVSNQPKKKKTCLWVDDVDEDDLSSSGSDSDCDSKGPLEGEKSNQDKKYGAETFVENIVNSVTEQSGTSNEKIENQNNSHGLNAEVLTNTSEIDDQSEKEVNKLDILTKDSQ